MNGIIFSASLSVSSLLVYREDTDFFMLNSYLTALLNVNIRSKSLLVEFFRSFGVGSSHLQKGII
jgi:hypothetical protein